MCIHINASRNPAARATRTKQPLWANDGTLKRRSIAEGARRSRTPHPPATRRASDTSHATTLAPHARCSHGLPQALPPVSPD